MGAGRWCWLLVALAALGRAMAEEEEEKASPLALGISTTLLGIVSFFITLMYGTNHPDADMRRITYSIVSKTISIFCAVLLFSTFNDFLEFYVLDGLPPYQQCAIDMAHMLFWYTMMQLSLAYLCGVIGNFNASDSNKSDFEKESAFELNVKCWSLLLAHLTGFASINAWGSLQQLPLFSSSPSMTLLVLPMSMAGQLILQRITDTIRERVNRMDDEVDESEAKWDEEAEECEDDVMGLTLSFNAAQSIRYFMSYPHRLPNQEGAWPLSFVIAQPSSTIWKIFLPGVACAIVVVLVIGLGLLKEKEGEEGESEEEEGGESHAEHGERGQHGEPHGGHEEQKKEGEGEGSLLTEVIERLMEMAVITISMIFAWCSFTSGQLLLASWMSALGPVDKMSLAMALALFVTAVSFGIIRILDLIADEDPSRRKPMERIIEAFGILIGFSWEQCFDSAVASIASRTTSPHLVKALLAVMCVGVFVPAYRKWILPMAILDGWRHGFVVGQMGDLSDIHETGKQVIKHLAKRMRQKHEQGVSLEDTQVLEKLQKVTGQLHKSIKGSDGYAPLPANEAEELKKLRRDSESYKAALREGIKALKSLQHAEEERAQGLRLHNQQMDTVLSSVRGLESRLLLNRQRT